MPVVSRKGASKAKGRSCAAYPIYRPLKPTRRLARDVHPPAVEWKMPCDENHNHEPITSPLYEHLVNHHPGLLFCVFRPPGSFKWTSKLKGYVVYLSEPEEGVKINQHLLQVFREWMKQHRLSEYQARRYAEQCDTVAVFISGESKDKWVPGQTTTLATMGVVSDEHLWKVLKAPPESMLHVYIYHRGNGKPQGVKAIVDMNADCMLPSRLRIPKFK